jgi:Amt family ammonium transporter
VTPDSKAATFTVGANIPELVYVCFQMTFAAITPALIVGSLVERMKFSAMALFLPLWLLLVYCPVAHMVWYWAGPDAIDAAAKALAAAADGAAKTAAQAKLDEVNADAGLIFQWGAIDFAGGTVVHINSGIAGMVGALLLGKRIGFGKELMPPHSLTLNMIGASPALGRLVRLQRRLQPRSLRRRRSSPWPTRSSPTAAAALAWMVGRVDGQGQTLAARSRHRRGSRASSRHAASGYAASMGALVLGIIAGIGCYIFCSAGEERLRLRRRARRVRRALHRRHHRRDPDRRAGRPLARRHPASWTTRPARSPTTTHHAGDLAVRRRSA